MSKKNGVSKSKLVSVPVDDYHARKKMIQAELDDFVAHLEAKYGPDYEVADALERKAIFWKQSLREREKTSA